MKRKVVKNILLGFFGLLLLVITITGCILGGRISSMMSIKKKADGLYTMNYKQNYHLDKALKADISDTEELYNFISKEMYFGAKLDLNLSGYACSAFTTTSPDGKVLVGRNFDLKGTDTLCLYTHPKNGFKSVSTVSTDILSVGGDNEITERSFKGRIALLASPYICVDGMNEKGVSAALLDMDNIGETHMATEKPDLIVSLAIRLILDKASNVDEAVKLLEQYDIQTAHGQTQHIYISDKTGKSVIVEWFLGKMKVVEYNVCTNFRMSKPSYEGNYSGQCDRFDKLDSALKEKNVNTVKESFSLLESVKQNGFGTYTIWSVVFNLTDFTVDYVVNMDYDHIYHLNPRKF